MKDRETEGKNETSRDVFRNIEWWDVRENRATLVALGQDQEDHEEVWGGCEDDIWGGSDYFLKGL